MTKPNQEQQRRAQHIINAAAVASAILEVPYGQLAAALALSTPSELEHFAELVAVAATLSAPDTPAREGKRPAATLPPAPRSAAHTPPCAGQAAGRGGKTQ